MTDDRGFQSTTRARSANVDETPPPPAAARDQFNASPRAAGGSYSRQNPAVAPGALAKVVLNIFEGPHAGATFDFDRHESLVVGRAAGVQLQLAKDAYFSRYHCRLEIRPPDCWLLDLGSRNGIYVNDRRVDEALLRNNDVISGGRTKIRFRVVPAMNPAGAMPAVECRPTTPSADAGAVIRSASSHHVPAIPGYDLVKELGHGAMGVVYQAVRRATGEVLAIKTIVPSADTSPQTIPLFIREASILSQLCHPRIVQFHEFGMARGEMYLAMEFVATVDLPRVLESQSMSARTRICCGIVCQVLEALDHAHSRSLVHRDIKPSNLLITQSGHKLNVKVSDFGLAKNYLEAGFSALTRDGEARGTLAFMPPEQIIDCRYAKPACDLYSAGATLYYLLAGAYPFEFSANRSRFSVVLEDIPIPLDQRRPDLPAGLVSLVHRALAKEPADRFATAREMHRALIPFTQRS